MTLPPSPSLAELVKYVNTERQIRALNKPRVWVYKPSFYWFGWSTFLPISRSHDEYSRETWSIGWSITGRIVIADKNPCGDIDCYMQTLSWVADEGMTEDEFLESLR